MREVMLRLKRGREARARVHPWVFKGDVADVGPAEAGDAVTVVDSRGHFVGRGFYNPQPALCCRVLTWREEAIDAAFFGRRIAAAVELRGGPPGPDPGRVVWSEADGLPGFVADRYGPVFAIQCSTLAMARRRADLVAALRACVGPGPVFSTDDPVPARLEGFEMARGWFDEPGPPWLVVQEGAVRLRVTFGSGHKTG